jgi:hypothetical protein
VVRFGTAASREARSSSESPRASESARTVWGGTFPLAALQGAYGLGCQACSKGELLLGKASGVA